MTKSKGGLGRGLGALLPDFDEPAVAEDERHKIVELDVERVKHLASLSQKERVEATR